MRTASLVHRRRDERRRGASGHPERALPGQGAMESGKRRSDSGDNGAVCVRPAPVGADRFGPRPPRTQTTQQHLPLFIPQ